MTVDNRGEMAFREIGVVQTDVHDVTVLILEKLQQHVSGSALCECFFHAKGHGRYFFP